MIENPFATIDRRLNKIESLLIEIKGDNSDSLQKEKVIRRRKRKLYLAEKEKEGSNG